MATDTISLPPAHRRPAVTILQVVYPRLITYNNPHQKKMGEMEMVSDNANLEQAQKKVNIMKKTSAKCFYFATLSLCLDRGG